MITQMAQTSLMAYGNMKNLKGKRLEVYRAILEHGPVCNADLAQILEWPINRITGRVKELRDIFRVEEAYKKKYAPTGQLVTYWQVRND